jgi:hypothetical protein
MGTISPLSPHLMLILPLDLSTRFLLHLGNHISLPAKLEENVQDANSVFRAQSQNCKVSYTFEVITSWFSFMTENN